MTGNRRRRGLVLQERDRHLLRELAGMRVVDRDQAKLVAGYGSTTRVNTRLLALTGAGFLRRFFFGTIAGGRRAAYSLSSKGAAAADVSAQGIVRKPDTFVVGDLFLEHQLCLNRVYLTLGYRPIPVAGARLREWRTFRSSLSAGTPVVPDAYFEMDAPGGVLPMFLEVDRGTESLKTWKRKIDGYLRFALSGEFPEKFRHRRFRVLVITSSERRLATIRATVAKHTDKVFWFSSFEFINREGFWSRVWLRPIGTERQSLL